ncbi:MAG: glutamate--tRNA ligase family protein [Nocardioidaceae bacterium]
MGAGNRKLSKRDPGGALATYREQGFLPEGLLNYLALLGWSIGGDRELFSMAEMAEAFEVERVNPNAAQFDLKKCEAINGHKIRELDARRPRAAARTVPAGRRGPRPRSTDDQRRLVRGGDPAVQERMACARARPWTCSPSCSSPTTRSRSTRPTVPSSSATTGCRSSTRRPSAPRWAAQVDAPSIEEALRTALVDDLGLKPRNGVRAGTGGRHRQTGLAAAVRVLGAARTRPYLAAGSRAVLGLIRQRAGRRLRVVCRRPVESGPAQGHPRGRWGMG